jgi:beta-lactamase class A
MTTVHAALTVLACLLPAAPPAPDRLEARLLPLAKGHKGRVAIAVKHLVTGETFFYNADAVMPTASLIKLPVLVEAYLQATEGKVKLADPVTLRKEDKVPGSGILTDHFSDGATFPLRDAVGLMVVFSDNTATNLVLDRVGIRAVNERMKAWGLKETRLNAKVYRGSTTSVDPARTRKYGLGSTTAREMVTLLEELQLSDRVRPAARLAVLGLLRKCDDKEKFSRFLPSGTDLAHKTGTVSDARTDAGILYLDDGAVALCVLSAGNADRSWRADNAGNLLCAKAAKAVYDHFTAPKAGAAGKR